MRLLAITTAALIAVGVATAPAAAEGFRRRIMAGIIMVGTGTMTGIIIAVGSAARSGTITIASAAAGGAELIRRWR